jgi:hypothetical protein
LSATGAILGLEKADATPLEMAQAQYENAVSEYERRKQFFTEIAEEAHIVAGEDAEHQAEAWANDLAIAELLRTHYASGFASEFDVTYNNLIGVVKVEDKQTGRMAALDSSVVDNWSAHFNGREPEKLERVLLALVFDKFIQCPDVEGRDEPHVAAPDLEEAERIRRARDEAEVNCTNCGWEGRGKDATKPEGWCPNCEANALTFKRA